MLNCYTYLIRVITRTVLSGHVSSHGTHGMVWLAFSVNITNEIHWLDLSEKQNKIRSFVDNSIIRKSVIETTRASIYRWNSLRKANKVSPHSFIMLTCQNHLTISDSGVQFFIRVFARQSSTSTLPRPHTINSSSFSSNAGEVNWVTYPVSIKPELLTILIVHVLTLSVHSY